MKQILKKYLPYCFALSMLTSCVNEDIHVTTYNLEHHDFQKWAELIMIESITPLEQKDSCILSYADKCIVEGDYILFNDHKSKTIYQFTKGGKLIRQIGNRGKSASEYLDIKDIWLESKNNNIIVMDDRGLITFDIASGKYIDRQKFNTEEAGRFIKFGVVDDNTYIGVRDSGDDDSSIMLDSPKGAKVLRQRKGYPFFVDFFYQHNDDNYVLSDYGEFYIDKYEDGFLNKVYEFNLGEYKLPKDELPKDSKEFDIVYEKPEYFKCLIEARETSKWLYAKIDGPQRLYYTAIINKDNGKTAFGPDFTISIVGTEGNSFFALVYPNYLPQTEFLYKILQEKGIACDENASPVLLKFSINEKLLL